MAENEYRLFPYVSVMFWYINSFFLLILFVFV